MSFRIFWRNPDGALSYTLLIADQSQAACEDAATRIIASGKRSANELAGIFEATALPTTAYREAWRVSAGAVVVKLDLARTLRHQQLAHQAEKRLKILSPLLLDALLDNDIARRDVLRNRRDQLKQLISTMPAEVANATTLSALDAITPAILTNPLP